MTWEELLSTTFPAVAAIISAAGVIVGGWCWWLWKAFLAATATDKAEEKSKYAKLALDETRFELEHLRQASANAQCQKLLHANKSLERALAAKEVAEKKLRHIEFEEPEK